MAKPVMIMAGGTGGHVFPALAVAQEMRSRGIDVVWIGTRRGLEARIVPAAGIPIEWIGVGGLRGKSALNWLVSPLRVTSAVLQAARILWRHKPQVVLGMGGFVSGPGGVASRLLGNALVIHEQNAIAGLTNRLLAPFSTTVLEAFAGTFAARVHARAVGNPIRSAIVTLPAPELRFPDRSGPLRVLVIGGSLGARALNEAVPTAVATLPEISRPQIWHQTGDAHLEATQANYAAAQVTARVESFIENMAEAYGWADLVVCRSGALTVSELAAAGVPSVLVPYPYAVDDHQRANGEYLVRAGAAEIVLQKDLTADVLGRIISGYIGEDGVPDRARLLSMAQAARSVAKPGATDSVLQTCMEAARV